MLNGSPYPAELEGNRVSEISISCDGRDSVAGFQEKLAAAESGGAAANWIANHLFQRDPITLAAISLGQTKRMRVTLMAVSPFTVHPVQHGGSYPRRILSRTGYSLSGRR